MANELITDGIGDLLPNELAGYLGGMIDQGMAVMKKTLEMA